MIHPHSNPEVLRELRFPQRRGVRGDQEGLSLNPLRELCASAGNNYSLRIRNEVSVIHEFEPARMIAVSSQYVVVTSMRDLVSRAASAPGLVCVPFCPGADATRLTNDISFQGTLLTRERDLKIPQPQSLTNPYLIGNLTTHRVEQPSVRV